MAFSFQNCSDLLWEKYILVIEKNFWKLRLKAENLENFWDPWNNLFYQWKFRTIFEKECFFTCSWRFLRFNILKLLKLKLGKLLGIRNLQKKLKNSVKYTWSTSWLISPAYCVVVWLSKVDLIGIPSLLTTIVPITPLIGQEQINYKTDFLSILRINLDVTLTPTVLNFESVVGDWKYCEKLVSGNWLNVQRHLPSVVLASMWHLNFDRMGTAICHL